jgi:hypothetical protein
MVLNGYADKVAGSPRFSQYPGNSLWSDVESDKTEGYEIEVTVNPTKQLRILLNALLQRLGPERYLQVLPAVV